MKIKQIIVIVTAVLMCGAAFAAGTVSDVKARQRYPWNGKVDIDCTLSGTAGTSYALTVNARDKVGCTNLAVKTVSVEGGSATGNPVSVTPGTYRLVWDAGTDLPNGFRGEKISISVSVSESAAGKKFMIVDLSSGAITYQATAPDGGWTDDLYKTTKMVFQRVEPGTYWQKYRGVCGRNVTISKPFYLSIEPITGGQCYEIMGKEGGYWAGDHSTWWRSGDTGSICFYGYRPDNYSFHKYLRGGDGWPEGGYQVASDSIIGKLRDITGKQNFDLPTWGQLDLANKTISLASGRLGCLDFAGGYVGEAAVADPVGRVAGYGEDKYRISVSTIGGNIGACLDSTVRLCMFDVD